MSAQPPAAQPGKPDNAIALVSSDDPDSLYATVQWLLNPLPGGSLLFERPDPRIVELERDLAAALADAERYRWLKDRKNGNAVRYVETYIEPDDLDAAIDAARASGNG